jgi:ABC-2 type transport system ATP-binding protein
MVDATDESAYDTIRDTVAELGLGLVRMEQRRHHIAEVFHTDEGAGTTDRAPGTPAAAAGSSAIPAAASADRELQPQKGGSGDVA